MTAILALALAAPGVTMAQSPSRAELETATTATGVRSARGTVARVARTGRERCTWAEAWRWGENLVGARLWDYHQRVDWCWNRRRVTYVHRHRWGVTHLVAWDFKGHIGLDTLWGRGKGWYRTWTQGKFQLCAGQFGCWQTKTPWVQLVARRGGTWSYRTGG